MCLANYMQGIVVQLPVTILVTGNSIDTSCIITCNVFDNWKILLLVLKKNSLSTKNGTNYYICNIDNMECMILGNLSVALCGICTYNERVILS